MPHMLRGPGGKGVDPRDHGPFRKLEIKISGCREWSMCASPSLVEIFDNESCRRGLGMTDETHTRK